MGGKFAKVYQWDNTHISEAVPLKMRNKIYKNSLVTKMLTDRQTYGQMDTTVTGTNFKINLAQVVS